MSIHQIRKPFIHPNCDTRPQMGRRNHKAPPPQPGLVYFFGGIIGTPTETALARLMARRGA